MKEDIQIASDLLLQIYNWEKILLTTPEPIDAGNIAVLFVLNELLEKSGKEVTICIFEEIPENLKFMLSEKFLIEIKVLLVNKKTPIETPPSLDTLLFEQPLLKDNEYIIAIGKNHFFTKKLNSKAALKTEKIFTSKDIIKFNSSACELIYNIFFTEKIRPSKPCARALYSGIVWSTGGFKGNRTTLHTHKIISELLSIGNFVPYDIFRSLFEEKPLNILSLLKDCLSSAKLIFNDRVVFSHLTLNSFLATGTDESSIKDIESYLFISKKIEVGVIFLETEDHKTTRILFYSKKQYNAMQILAEWNPIGDARKASIILPYPLKKAKKNLKKRLSLYFSH